MFGSAQDPDTRRTHLSRVREEVEVFTVRGRISADSVCECGYVFRAEEQYVSPGLQRIFDEAKKRAEGDD